MHALVIDGDPNACFAISHMLTAAGWTADRADSAAQGLAFLGHNRYDIVISELELPDLSGQELVQRIRSTGTAHPLLVLSHSQERQAQTIALAAGADAYLRKPIDSQQLLARARKVTKHPVPAHPRDIPRRTAKRTALLVEDEPGLADAIEDELSEIFQVRCVVDAPAALEWLRREPPGLALIDSSLAGDRISEVLAHIDSTRTAIVLMAGNSELSSDLAAFLGYPSLCKPFSVGKLWATVDKALSACVSGKQNAGCPEEFAGTSGHHRSSLGITNG